MTDFQFTMSSPLSFASAAEIQSSPIRPDTRPIRDLVYRPVKLLPFALREHCKIYFEESLCIAIAANLNYVLIIGSDGQALKLLISLVTTGNTSVPPLPAFIPPPHHLAFAATLAIHPTLTTRARSQNLVDDANLALKYLREVLKIVGPVNANLQDAFIFTGLGTSSRRGGGGRRRVNGGGTSPNGDDLDNIGNTLAETGSIWALAEDIWQVAGWAFNCSVLHKKRWTRWRLWLEYMIDVLQDDWNARGVGLEKYRARDRNEDDPREKSMVVMSLSFGDLTTGKERRVVRAVFADGGAKAVGEFLEIWENETKERKKDADVQKVEKKIDIEADNYGDYMDEDGDSDLVDGDPEIVGNFPPNRHNDPKPQDPRPNLATPLGGMDAIDLRIRILSLLSTVSATLPHCFTSLTTLYDIYLEHVRPLPLPTFFLLISPSSLRHFSPPAASSLTQYLLRSLIAASAPLPAKDDLAQEVLEESYLPFAANTSSIVDNAKVSLCVETLLRLLDIYVGLTWTPSLQDAVEAGIDARDTKAKRDGRTKPRDKNGERERVWLVGSANRIRSVVRMAKP